MAQTSWQPIQSNYVAPSVTPVQVDNNAFAYNPAPKPDNSTNDYMKSILNRVNGLQNNLSEMQLNNMQLMQQMQNGMYIQDPMQEGDKPATQYMQDFYDQFRARGFDHNQAVGLIMNINAENGFMPKYLFGTHNDGGRTAYGALSWQNGRETELLNRLSKMKLYKDGKFVQSSETIKAMADYMVDELKSGKQGNFLAFKGSNPYEYAREANRTYTRSSRDPRILAGRERSYATVGRIKFRGN